MEEVDPGSLYSQPRHFPHYSGGLLLGDPGPDPDERHAERPDEHAAAIRPHSHPDLHQLREHHGRFQKWKV